MIVGATPERATAHILTLTQSLYDTYHLKRVFYSAYVPVVEDTLLPSAGYQAAAAARAPALSGGLAAAVLRLSRRASCSTKASRTFDPLLDPKCCWALRHPELLPGRGQPRGLRSAAARSRHRRGKREAHPCRAPRRGAARRGPEKARRRAQAGAVFSHTALAEAPHRCGSRSRGPGAI